MADDAEGSIQKHNLDAALWGALFAASPRSNDRPTTVADLLAELIRQGVDVHEECRHAAAQLHTERIRGETTLTVKALLEIVVRDGERPQHIVVDGGTTNYRGISSVTFDYQAPRTADRGRYDPPIQQLHKTIDDQVTVKFSRDR